MFCILSHLFTVAIIACGSYTHPGQVLWWELGLVQMLDDSFSRPVSHRLAEPHFLLLLHAAGTLLLGSSSQLHLPCDVTEQRGSTLACAIRLELAIRGILLEVTTLAQCPFPATVAPSISESGGLRSPWWEAVVRKTYVTCDMVYETCQNGIGSSVSILCPC